MASEKRKRANDSSDARPEKKSKLSKPVSRLTGLKEEPAFQRGGASILTPLEQKQIQVQATRDALFEQSTGQQARNVEFSDDENKEPTAAPARTKRRRTEKHGADRKPSNREDSGFRMEGLSYKVRLRKHSCRDGG